MSMCVRACVCVCARVCVRVCVVCVMCVCVHCMTLCWIWTCVFPWQLRHCGITSSSVQVTSTAVEPLIGLLEYSANIRYNV